MCPSIVHVLPSDLRRGAQSYAADLVPELDAARAHGRRHSIVTLFSSPAARLHGDSLEVPGGIARQIGFDVRALRRLRRHVRDRRADIVVAHGGEALKYAALLGRGPRLVYLKIGSTTPAARTGLRWRWHRWLVQRADAIVGVSTDVAAEVCELFTADPARVHVIPNGRDPAVYFPIERGEVDHLPPQLLFVGHMTATKRPGLFVHVIERLRDRGLPLRAAMVGDGPELDAIRPRAERVAIDVLGARDDVPSLMRSADLFVFTSVPEGEGMPGVLIEAALSGLPVVTTAVPGAADVVVDGDTGFVRAPDDVDGVADACAALLTDASRRRSFGRAGQDRARERFTLSDGARRWEELFSALLGNGSP